MKKTLYFWLLFILFMMNTRALSAVEYIQKIAERAGGDVNSVEQIANTGLAYDNTEDKNLRYIGSNPYLQNIIYSSIAPNKYLYLNSGNPQFLYLKKLRMTAVFEDFENAKDLLCDDNGEGTPCDILDMDFPIREHLVPPLIELVVKELTGAKYQPQDTRNNANDDLPNKAK